MQDLYKEFTDCCCCREFAVGIRAKGILDRILGEFQTWSGHGGEETVCLCQEWNLTQVVLYFCILYWVLEKGLHSRTGRDKTKRKTQEKMERRSGKRSSSVGREKMERVGDR